MKFRIIAIGLAIVLAGCQGPKPGPIEPVDSMLRLDLPDGAWPPVTRNLVEVREYRKEIWDWPSGALRTVRTRRKSYFPQDFADPEDLIENVGRWPSFVRTDVDRRSVRTGRNAIGAFQYATAVKRDRLCFFMLQGLPESRPSGYEPALAPKVSSGYITFYQCAPKDSTTKAELETRGLNFAEALSRNW